MNDLAGPYVIPLGVAAALPDADHANTYLSVVGEHGYWLIDCADSPIGRLEKAGIDPLTIQGVIITHFHPDHVYGLPAFLLGIFLLAAWKRDEMPEPVHIYAHAAVLPKVKTLVNVFADQSWMEMLPIIFCEIPPHIDAFVAENADFTITAAPTEHSIDSIALKFNLKGTQRNFVYSSDTKPCDAVAHLAQDASLLFHEATDSDKGHTRPAAAGALAMQAGVERLTLIHYYTQLDAMAYALEQARTTFDGDVTLAKAFTRYPW